MSTYTKSCPNCSSIITAGHGDPLKHLGNPLKMCETCGAPYIDVDTIEWSVSPTYRKVGYFFANNRWMLFLIPFIVLPLKPWFALVMWIAFFLLCWLYVKNQVDNEVIRSIERTSDEEYVRMLTRLGYPVAEEKKLY